MGSTTTSGIIITTFFTTTTTITLKLPPVTVEGIPFYNVNVTRGQGSSNIIMSTSVDIPSIPVVLPGPSGSSTTRFITVPPWPAVTNGPPSGTNIGGIGGSSGEVSVPGQYRTPYSTVVTATAATVTTVALPSTVSAITFRCPPDSTIVFNTPRTTVTSYCNDPATVTLGFTCPPSRVVTFLGPSTAVISADCALNTAFAAPSDPEASPPDDEPPPATTTTEIPLLPVWTYWPGDLIPIPTPIPGPGPPPGRTTCKLWFFSVRLTTLFPQFNAFEDSG